MNKIKLFLLSNRPVFEPVAGRFAGKRFVHNVGYDEVPEQYKDFFIPRGDTTSDKEGGIDAE